MKRFCFLLAIMIVNITTIQAQTKAIPGYTENYGLNVMPSCFSFDKKPLLQIKNDKIITLYDSNIDEVTTLNIPDEEIFTFSKTYNIKKRQVKEVVLDSTIQVGVIGTYNSFNDFINRELMLDPQLTPESITVDTSTGDSIIIFPKTNYSQIHYVVADYFGTQYPIDVFLWKNNSLYRQIRFYHIKYTDWQDAGTNTTETKKHSDVLTLRYVNLNNDNSVSTNNSDYQSEQGFLVSQTLFNNTKDYEYVVKKYSLRDEWPSSNEPNTSVINPYNNYYDYNLDTIRNEATSNKDVACTGVRVYSSNGSMLYDLDFGDSFELSDYVRFATVLAIGDNTYLVFEGKSNESGETKEGFIFYKIDVQTNSIQKVKNVPTTFNIIPSIADNNTPLNITLQGSTNNSSDITVFSSNGVKVASKVVPANTNTSQITVSVPNGIYNVARIQKGKILSTQKIIVK